MEQERLKDEEVLALKEILIAGNKRIVGLHFYSSYYGRGGSNFSPETVTTDAQRTLAELAAEKSHESFGMDIRAIVNDVVYLTTKWKVVIAFDADGKYSDSYEIAYDTMGYHSIKPILKEENA